MYIPAELTPILKLARGKQPYSVVPIQYNDFWDYKQLSLDWRVLCSRRDSDADATIKGNNVIVLTVTKEHRATIFYKNSHLESSYKTVTLKRKANNFCLRKLNQDPPKVPTPKYNDLVSLLSDWTSTKTFSNLCLIKMCKLCTMCTIFYYQMFLEIVLYYFVLLSMLRQNCLLLGAMY